MYLKIREDVTVRFSEGSMFFYGATRPFTIRRPSEIDIVVVRQLLFGADAKLFAEQFGKVQIISFLLKHDLLLKLPSNASRDEIWLSHFMPNVREKLSKISDLAVMIIGCGGTGSIVADHLARAGVRQFILVDGGKVDDPDLNRQWSYSRADIGRFKVKAMSERLAGISNDCKIISIPENLDEKSAAKIIAVSERITIKLLVCCADEPAETIEVEILNLARSLNCALLLGAVGIKDYVVGPLLSSGQQQEEYLRYIADRKAVGYTISGSSCFINTIASAEIARLAYFFLLGILPEHEEAVGMRFAFPHKGQQIYPKQSMDGDPK